MKLMGSVKLIFQKLNGGFWHHFCRIEEVDVEGV
jgi:hypothetical protein